MLDLYRRIQTPPERVPPGSGRNNSPRSRRLSSTASDGGQNRASPRGSLTVTIQPDSRETQGSDKAVLVELLQRLIRASGDFIHDMEYDPDPYGVAVSFSQHFRQLRNAYTDWATIVGELVLFCAPAEMKKPRLSHSLSMPGMRRPGGLAAIPSGKLADSEAAQASRLDLPDIVCLVAHARRDYEGLTQPHPSRSLCLHNALLVTSCSSENFNRVFQMIR